MKVPNHSFPKMCTKEGAEAVVSSECILSLGIMAVNIPASVLCSLGTRGPNYGSSCTFKEVLWFSCLRYLHILGLLLVVVFLRRVGPEPGTCNGCAI